MNIYIVLISVFILLEIFESNWQKAPTLHGVMYNNYAMYQKSVLFYFLINPTFIYSLFLSFYLNLFNFWMSSIIVIKFIDIAFRLHIISKLTKGFELNEFIPIDINMNNVYRYLNVIIYPLSFLFSLNILR